MPLADPRPSTRLRRVNRELLDRAIRHAVFLRRLEAGIFDRTMDESGAIRSLESLERALIERIATLRPADGFDIPAMAQRQLRGIQRLVRERMEAARKRMARTSEDELVELALAERDFAIRALRLAMDARAAEILLTDPSLPAPGLMREIVRSRPFEGNTLSRWWQRLARRTQEELMTELRIGLMRGESVSTMTDRVREVVRMVPRRAEAVVRSAATHVSAQAREETYRGIGIVRKIQWVSTLDARTTVICQTLDGRVFPVGEGPRPPAHVNCRSTTTPVVPSIEQMARDRGIRLTAEQRERLRALPRETRAAFGGPVDRRTTYETWLRRQPASVQDEILGKGRAEIFRRGKVRFERFVDRDLRPLTVRELRELEERLEG